MAREPLSYHEIRRQVRRRLISRIAFWLHFGAFSLFSVSVLGGPGMRWNTWWAWFWIILIHAVFTFQLIGRLNSLITWPFRRAIDNATQREIERLRAQGVVVADAEAREKPKRDRPAHLADDGEIEFEDESDLIARQQNKPHHVNQKN